MTTGFRHPVVIQPGRGVWRNEHTCEGYCWWCQWKARSDEHWKCSYKAVRMCMCMCMCEIKNNAWTNENNVVLVTNEVICQWFSRVTKWWVKSLVNDITSIHGNECIILLITRYFVPWTHNSAKNNHQSLILQLLPRSPFSDLALWCHHSWSVTSSEREVLALWRHIRWLFLHAQIGAMVIFTNEYNNREYRFLATWHSWLSM